MPNPATLPDKHDPIVTIAYASAKLHADLGYAACITDVRKLLDAGVVVTYDALQALLKKRERGE